MKNKKRSTENGQALIIIVFAMVALLGFTALAIDGSMVYADRRHEQNAADASTLAGGAAAGKYLEVNSIDYFTWDCNSLNYNLVGQILSAAQSRAEDNGYTIDFNIDDKNGVEVQCGNISHTAFWERYIDIRTMITADTDTSFVHFVYSGPVRNTVESVTRIKPKTPLGFGNAIIAVNTASCSGNQNGVQFGGSSQNSVTGGGVFSNGCLGGNGGEFTLTVEDGTISAAGSLEGTITSSSQVSPTASIVPDPITSDMYAITPPDCSSLDNLTQTGSGTIYPGKYTSLSLHTGTLHLEPGLYCLTGSSNVLSVNGGEFTGYGVTIYIESPTGGIDIGGNGIVKLHAPYGNPDPSPAIPDVLIYSNADLGNQSAVKLVGNDESEYLGAIYVPNGTIDISGANDTNPTFNTQLIGKNVFVSGNATIDIIYNGGENYEYPSRLELYK